MNESSLIMIFCEIKDVRKALAFMSTKLRHPFKKGYTMIKNILLAGLLITALFSLDASKNRQGQVLPNHLVIKNDTQVPVTIRGNVYRPGQVAQVPVNEEGASYAGETAGKLPIRIREKVVFLTYTTGNPSDYPLESMDSERHDVTEALGVRPL